MEQGIAIVIGAVLPPVIDFINKKVQSSNWRYIISLIISLVVGAVISFFTGELTGVDILAAGGIVFASAQTVYKTYYADSTVRLNLFGKDVAKR